MVLRGSFSFGTETRFPTCNMYIQPVILSGSRSQLLDVGEVPGELSGLEYMHYMWEVQVKSLSPHGSSNRE